MGSPLTGLLCATIADRLDRDTALGQHVLDWPGDPDGWADGLPLRLCGGLHALFRSGTAPRLAACYPPNQLPDQAGLARVLREAFDDHAAFLLPWLDRTPQTNEVGRSSALMAGLLVAADRFPLPMQLLELGASAGLNLLLDRFRHDLGGTQAGDPNSPLLLRPDWQGPAPPAAQVCIAARRGVDLHPVDPVADRERLLAYVWPDQPQRLRQIEAALAIAAAEPPQVDARDAADWLDVHLPSPEAGVTCVVMHSVAWQYFPEATQARAAADCGGRRGGAGGCPARLAALRKGAG
jgi:hypothetical protein